MALSGWQFIREGDPEFRYWCDDCLEIITTKVVGLGMAIAHELPNGRLHHNLRQLYNYKESKMATRKNGNAARQPVTQKAVGNPDRGRPAAVIAKVENTAPRLDSKVIDPGDADVS